MTGGQILLGDESISPIKVSISQFYGIEINDFAVTVAKTALKEAEIEYKDVNNTSAYVKFPVEDSKGL